eukprot:scaffold50361_cov52-Attheya_sp.AAC.4
MAPTAAAMSSGEGGSTINKVVVMGSKVPTAVETAALLKQWARPILDDPRKEANRLDDLRRLFAKLATAGQLSYHFRGDKATSSRAQEKWAAHLERHFDNFVHHLCSEEALGLPTSQSGAALRTLCGVIASVPHPKYKQLHSDLIQSMVEALVSVVSPKTQDGLYQQWQTEFVAPFRDVSYATLGAIQSMANNLYTDMKQKSDVSKHDVEENDDEEILQQSERLVQLLMRIDIATSQAELDSNSTFLFTPPNNTKQEQDVNEDDDKEQDSESDEEDDESVSEDESDESKNNKKRSQSSSSNNNKSNKKAKKEHLCPVERQAAHCKAFEAAWLAVLRLPLSTCTLKRVLLFLPANVLPLVKHPLRLADFFSTCYQQHTQRHALMSVLALNGLFVLMTQHELEYPNFYASLYTLIKPSVFYAKYRTRFFRLLGKCLLGNALLPGYLVAAFCKRLLGCAASSVPPSGALFSIALVSNLLRKHPECACLLHRDANEDGTITDHYDALTDDPAQSRGTCCLPPNFH